jgi:hypothetical protein
VLALLALFACAPKSAPPAPAVVAAVDLPVAPSAPEEVPDVTAVAFAPALTPEAMATATPLPVDARQLVNAWRERHNAGVARLQAGDAAGALVEARAAVELAPPELRDEPLVLVAVAASQAGEGVVEIEALARVGDGADVHWGVYYNGGVDAVTAGRPDLAHRFAQAALARGGDVAQVAPLAVRAALRVEAFDAALVAGGLLPADHPTRADLVRALVGAGRCVDAERLAPGACG